MKKYIISLIIALFVLAIPTVKAVELPEKTDHEVVKVNLFWASWCGHCHDFIEYFSDKYAEYSDYFEIVTYLVDTDNGNNIVENEENGALMQAAAEYFDENAAYPLIVVGDNYHQLGFGSDGSDIIKAALDEYQNEDYVDIVTELITKEKVNPEVKDFEHACSIAKVKCSGVEETKKISDGVIIGIIFGVIILGFGGLIIYSNKK